MINGNDLIRQTVETNLGTNKGEWFLDIDEGIEFSNLLGKEKTEETIKNEILQGLSQVDSSFYLTHFSFEFNKLQRKLRVEFAAQNEEGETIEGGQEWH